MVNYWNAFIVGSALSLVLVTILGPIYALVWVSCTSTRSCTYGAALYNLGATCAEGLSEEMMHGEECTVQCNTDGMVPNVPILTCNDGTMDGLDDLVCSSVVVYSSRASVGGTVEGAVTSGDSRTACSRASSLTCTAASGGTAIFVQLSDLTKAECQELFQECIALNSEFEYMSFTLSSEESVTGTCVLGCYEEILSDEALLAIPWAERTSSDSTTYTSSTLEECSDGPMCIDVTGSCNEDDDGDYYRYAYCASSQTQWAKTDLSRRLRYDGTPAYSQSGKWIIEADFPDINTDEYGTTMARQPSFTTSPIYRATSWRVRCLTQVTALTVQEEYKMVSITLATCTCTDDQDCSGNGQAVGTKTDGPDCACVCDTGWDGDACDIPLCQATYVQDATDPPCEEGIWFQPGEVCTLSCKSGYSAEYETYLCGDDGTWPSDQLFACNIIPSQNIEDGAIEEEDGVLTTTTQGDCTDKDCNWRGTATGLRYLNGTCVCECYEEYTGVSCRSWVGNCEAPSRLDIENSAVMPCKEGLIITGDTCTAQCIDGYWASPRTLECRGEILAPTTFSCIGGPDVREVWCSAMQYIAFSSSGVAICGLALICLCYGKEKGREVQNFFNRNQLIEVGVDEEGKYNVIKAELQDTESKLPRSVATTVAPMMAVTDDRPFALNNANAITDQAYDTGAVSRFSAERALLRDDLRHLAVVAATEAAKLAVEMGPLIPEYQYSHEQRPHLSDNNGGVRALMAPALLSGSEAHEVGAGGGSAALALPGATEEPETTQLALFQTGTLGETAEIPKPSGRFKPGQQVSLAGLIGHQALNGVQGVLVEFDYDMGVWIVQLEGFENELKQVPERHLQEIVLSIHEATAQGRSEWLMERHALEEKADAARQEYDRQMRERKNAAAVAARNGQLEALQAAEQERLEAEAALQQAFAAGDIEALRIAITKGRAVLEKISHCSASDRALLIRLCNTGESRIEQYDTRELSRAAHRKHEAKIVRGEVPDWKMTPKDFWRYVEEGDLGRVSGGIKAMQSMSTRTTDGLRQTIVHIACKRAYQDSLAGAEALERRLAVVQALVEAKANPNSLDAVGRTPLDLAVLEATQAQEEALRWRNAYAEEQRRLAEQRRLEEEAAAAKEKEREEALERERRRQEEEAEGGGEGEGVGEGEGRTGGQEEIPPEIAKGKSEGLPDEGGEGAEGGTGREGPAIAIVGDATEPTSPVKPEDDVIVDSVEASERGEDCKPEDEEEDENAEPPEVLEAQALDRALAGLRKIGLGTKSEAAELLRAGGGGASGASTAAPSSGRTMARFR